MSHLLEVKELRKYFPLKVGLFRRGKGFVHAVDGISFHVDKSETFGLVGESGCGKTTTGRLILRLLEPTSGAVFFEGRNIFKLKKNEIRAIRRKMQIIFQDPMSSLNPRKTVLNILSQPFKIHTRLGREEVENKASELLEAVQLVPSAVINKFPHELSGGIRQRIGIARAIALRPSLIVADEPVSSLDMSIRGQVLTLMKRLQREFGLTYLFISHDLSVVRSICNRVAVMYLGKITELASVNELYNNPLHPYTKSLLLSTPIPDPRKSRMKQRIILTGEVPSPINPPPGCRFHARCFNRKTVCMKVEPQLVDVGDGHLVACHFYDGLKLKV